MNFKPTLRTSGVYNIFFELNINNKYSYLIDDLRPLFEINSQIKQYPLKKELILKGPKIDPEFKNVMESGAFQGIIASMIQNNVIDTYSFVSEKIYKPEKIIQKKKQSYLPIPAQKNETAMYSIIKEFLTSFIKVMENFFNPKINVIFKKNSKYRIVSLTIEDSLELVDINTNDPLIDNKVIFKDGKVKFSPEILTYIPLLAKVSIFIKPIHVPNLTQIRSLSDVKEYKGYYCEKNRFDFKNAFRNIRNKELDIQTHQIIGQTYKDILFRFDNSKKSPFKLVQQMKQNEPVYYFNLSLDKTKDNGKLFSIFEKQLTVNFKQKLLRCKEAKNSIQMKQCLENKMKELNRFIRAYVMIWYKWNGIYLNQLMPNLYIYSDKEYEVEIFEPKMELVFDDSSTLVVSNKNIKKTINELDYVISQNKKMKALNVLNMSLQNSDFNGFTKDILQKIANILGVTLFKSDLKYNIITKLIHTIKELQDAKKLNVTFNNVMKNTPTGIPKPVKKMDESIPSSTGSSPGTPTFVSNSSTEMTTTSVESGNNSIESPIKSNETTTQKDSKYGNWIQNFLKNPNYKIIENPASGDCFFYTVQKGFENYNILNKKKQPTYTMNEIRSKLADNLTETIFEQYKTMYDSIVNNIQEYENEMKQNPEDSSIQQKIMNEKDILSEYEFMKDVENLGQLKEKVKTCVFWADEMTLSMVEEIFNIKLILFSKQNYDSDKLNNVVICRTPSHRMIQDMNQGTFFKPSFYLLLEYTGNHYRNIAIVDTKKDILKIALQFKDIPTKIKNVLVDRCMKTLNGDGEFDVIQEFKNYKSSKTGIVQATPKPTQQKAGTIALKQNNTIRQLLRKHKNHLKHTLTLKNTIHPFRQSMYSIQNRTLKRIYK